LREQEAGQATADVCRRHGISTATFYNWKAKFGGLDVSDAQRLKALEDENAKLKKLLAEAMLDNAILKDVASKNGDARRETRCRRARRGTPRGARAAGVPDARRRPVEPSVPEPPTG
jgi:putative transposase